MAATPRRACNALPGGRRAAGSATPDPGTPFEVLPDWPATSPRGCSFVNAFAELPEPAHPGRQIVVAETTWLRDLFADLLREAGLHDVDDLAVQLLSLHEGAITTHAITADTHAAASARSGAELLVTTALTRR